MKQLFLNHYSVDLFKIFILNQDDLSEKFQLILKKGLS
jgi:hypothetical protein